MEEEKKKKTANHRLKTMEDPMMRIYILKAMVDTGREIRCAACRSQEVLTFSHDKYWDHTIFDIQILCWPCHSAKDFGKPKKTPKNWKGIEVKEFDGKNHVCWDGMCFALD